MQAIVQNVTDLTVQAESAAHEPVLVVSPSLRRPLVRLLNGVPNVPAVLSFREVGPQVELVTVGTVPIPTGTAS